MRNANFSAHLVLIADVFIYLSVKIVSCKYFFTSLLSSSHFIGSYGEDKRWEKFLCVYLPEHLKEKHILLKTWMVS